MPTTFRRFATLLSTGLLLAHSAKAAALQPKVLPARIGSLLPRQQPCQKATLDVSQDRIIDDVCASNPQNNYSQCHDQLIDYIQQSINPTCEHNDELHNDCLAVNQFDEKLCIPSLQGYLDCGNYTLQAYAYCGCLFSTPYDLFRCAKVQLEARPYLPASIVVPNVLPTVKLPGLPGQSLISFLTNVPIASAIFTPVTSIVYPAIPSSVPVIFPLTSALISDVIPSLVPSGLISDVIPSLLPTGLISDVIPSLVPGIIIPSNTGSGRVSVPQTLTPTITAPSISTTPSSGTQSTSTTLSTTVVVKTLTITSCAATVPDCPATTTTTASTKTWTVMVCDGGCTGPAPVRATGVCVRRRVKGEL